MHYELHCMILRFTDAKSNLGSIFCNPDWKLTWYDKLAQLQCKLLAGSNLFRMHFLLREQWREVFTFYVLSLFPLGKQGKFVLAWLAATWWPRIRLGFVLHCLSQYYGCIEFHWLFVFLKFKFGNWNVSDWVDKYKTFLNKKTKNILISFPSSVHLNTQSFVLCLNTKLYLCHVSS